ncbi:hypothetical protein [Methylocella sp.]|uniref:hypothetical protein n=1 Tax=Methylocella sp. TaxID=1978226 RepID=UPI003782E61B
MSLKPPASPLDRILAGALWALALALCAVAAHVVLVLYLPKFVGETPMRRLAPYSAYGETRLLPRATPAAQWTPFLDPAVAEASCLFDLSRAPLRVSGEVEPGRMLTLSFREPDGDVFYSMTDRAAQRGRLDVLLLTQEQLDAVEAEDDDDRPAQELRLVAPSLKGFVLIGALANFPGEWADAERRAKAIVCKPEEPVEP